MSAPKLGFAAGEYSRRRQEFAVQVLFSGADRRVDIYRRLRACREFD